MKCEQCGYDLLDGEKRLHGDCGCDFCGTVKRHELWVPECHAAVCHNENEKRIADAVAAERERCADLIGEAFAALDGLDERSGINDKGQNITTLTDHELGVRNKLGEFIRGLPNT